MIIHITTKSFHIRTNILISELLQKTFNSLPHQHQHCKFCDTPQNLNILSDWLLPTLSFRKAISSQKILYTCSRTPTINLLCDHITCKHSDTPQNPKLRYNWATPVTPSRTTAPHRNFKKFLLRTSQPHPLTAICPASSMKVPENRSYPVTDLPTLLSSKNFPQANNVADFRQINS